MFSLRTRITFWYVLLVGLTLIAFSVFIYFRLQNSLVSQLDLSLVAARSQALSVLRPDGGRLVFDQQDIEMIADVVSFTEDSLTLSDGTILAIDEDTDLIVPLEVGSRVEVDARISSGGLIAIEVDSAEDKDKTPRPEVEEQEEEDDETGEEAEPDEETSADGQNFNLSATQQASESEFIIRVVGPNGIVWDSLGDTSLVPFSVPEESDFAAFATTSDSAWRVHSLELISSEGVGVGWLQTATSFDSVDETLGNVRAQLFWGIPLAIVLAALGGLFVADQGLRPIDRITRTAQTISGSVLNRRINHKGPNDEVGRLSNTFDAMLDRLEDAFERERRFTSDASHELRTPLTSLKGRIDVALSSPRTEKEYVETLCTLEEEAERLIRLSNELLFLARLDQGRIPLEPGDVDLSNLLGAVIDQIRPLAESKGLTIVEEVPSNLSVCGDSDQLIRLFLNIVDNAYKFTPPGGKVTIHAENSGSEVRISITDTGPGIPEDHLTHLFERFYRVDAARSRESGGSGLGLAISNEIVQMHNGKLEVKSEVGLGTAFTITLPNGPL